MGLTEVGQAPETRRKSTKMTRSFTTLFTTAAKTILSAQQMSFNGPLIVSRPTNCPVFIFKNTQNIVLNS